MKKRAYLAKQDALDHLKEMSILVAMFMAFFSLTPSICTAAEEFFWGAANAAYQVEGTPLDSDWQRWTHQSGKVKDGTNADTATDFWNRYAEDFTLAQKLGSNAFRISISWERVFPKDGQLDEVALAHYEQMIVDMRKHGLEPMVTLHHFVTPGWIMDQGGIEGPRFVSAFTEFSEKVVARLSKAPANVKWWMTFNEPMVLVNASYLAGEWPPQKKDPKLAMRIAAQLVRAHFAALAKIRVIAPDAKVSVASHWRDFQPASRGLLDRLINRMTAWAFNEQFMNSALTGKLLFWMPGSEWISETISLPAGRPGLDYFGLNYYGRTIVGFDFHPPFVSLGTGPGTRTDLDWEIYPEGFRNVLLEINNKYHLPILVTENGVADHVDEMRRKFIIDHLESMMKAKSEGVPVIGYLHWSLTDNFEWAYGLTPKFGLVEVDYKTLARKPRGSFEIYRQRIERYKHQP